MKARLNNRAANPDYQTDLKFFNRLYHLNLKPGAYSQFKNVPTDRNLDHWLKLFDDRSEQGPEKEPEISIPDGENKEQLTFQSTLNTEKADEDRTNRITFQLHNKYVVSQVKSGMLLIDQQAAHERILFERFLNNLSQNSSNSQQSLFPVTVELNPSDYSLVMEMGDEIRALGFGFEDFGTNCIVINGTPAELHATNEKLLFEGLIEQYKMNNKELSLSTHENLARSLAKRTAVTDGTTLKSEEMNSLIDELFACENPNYSPGGSKTYFILDLNQISRFFS